MASRDFSFLSLRPPLVAYQANGLPVPPNTVLITSSTGAATFSNTVTISTINASTSNSNFISSGVISAGLIDVDVLSTNTHFTSSISTSNIYTGFLQANQAIISGPTLNTSGNASLTVNNTISIIGDSPVSSQLFLHNGKSRLGTSAPYGGLYLEASTPNSIYFASLNASAIYGSIGPNQSQFNGNVNVASTLSANDITVTSSINLLNSGGSPLELNWNTTQLFIDGHPVATDGTVSTVSTVFWDPNTDGEGNIVNKNQGTGTTKYLVGIGYDKSSTINATLDVIYKGTTAGNVLNISTSNNNRLTMDSDGIVSITSSLNVNGSTYISSGLTLNGITPGGYGALKIEGGIVENDIFIRDGSQVNSAVNSGYFVGISNNYGGPSTFQIGRVDNGNAQVTKSLYLTQSGNVGIGTTNPINTLDVNGIVRIGNQSGNTSSFEINLGTSGVGAFRSALIYSDGTNMEISNQQVGNLSLATNNTEIITILSSGNVGIGSSNPQTKLDVNGALRVLSGNAAAPGIFFSTDTNTGLYGISDGQMGIAANGQQRLLITNNNIDLTPNTSTSVNITTTSPNNYTTLNVINNGTTSTSSKIYMTSNDISYGIYTTNKIGAPSGSGLIPSTFQIYSYFSPNPIDNKNVLTIYPNGNTNINGDLNIGGSAISRVATTAIVANPGSAGWTTYFGKYCFVNGDSVGTLTLPSGGDVPSDGTVLVIRNIGSTTPITVSGSNGGNSILAGKTTSYVYTTSVASGWYAL